MADQVQANQANSGQTPAPVPAQATTQTSVQSAQADAAKPSMPVAPVTEVKPAEVQPAESSMATPAAPSAPVDGANSENKNVFTELFGNDKAQKNAALMGNVVKQQDKKTVSMLGGKGSKLQELREKGKSSLKISKSTPGKLVMQVSVVALIAVCGFFYSQNSTNFTWLGANVAKRAEIAQEQIDNVNAEIYVQKYLSAALLLEQYTSMADEYFYNLNQAESSYNSENKRDTYAEKAGDMRPDMLNLLAQAQDYMSDTISPEDKALAKTVVEGLIEDLHAKSGEVDQTALLQDIQDLESTKKLMQSGDFRTLILAMDTENAADADLETIYNDYTTISASVGSLISAIKDKRVDWSVYLKEIEDLTKDVDPLFNTEFAGNLTISDVKFNGGSVLVSGTSLTDDTKNFTLVSDLIDIYEDSDLFENVEDRSYSKSESDEESYSGNFRISMDITNQ